MTTLKISNTRLSQVRRAILYWISEKEIIVPAYLVDKQLCEEAIRAEISKRGCIQPKTIEIKDPNIWASHIVCSFLVSEEPGNPFVTAKDTYQMGGPQTGGIGFKQEFQENGNFMNELVLEFAEYLASQGIKVISEAKEKCQELLTEKLKTSDFSIHYVSINKRLFR